MSSVCIRLGFSCNAHTFARPKQLIYSSPNHNIEPDFYCLADEIADPRPDMNIKVAAFTESKKFYYYFLLSFSISGGTKLVRFPSIIATHLSINNLLEGIHSYVFGVKARNSAGQGDATTKRITTGPQQGKTANL